MEEVTAGIPNCAVYLDDIIVTGRNNKEHLNNVLKIFQRLEEYGLTCKSEKCSFAQEQVDYVGHVINVNGLMPTGKRVEAIKLMPRPRNIQEVEAFIGKVNYYNKFIKQFSILAAPLNELRKKNAVFKWTAYHEGAFQALKNAMIKATELVHYDDKKPIVLAVDASKYGIGAVISHRYADGSEKPIAYASKKLNSSQERYSQIEKEALAIIYGVTKFHQYLYGRRFELITDHQALTTLFNPNRKLPVMALHRLQRWAIVLQAYEYIIRFKSSSQNANADALSRLPCGDDIQFDRKEVVMLDDVDTVYQNAVDYLPVNATLVKDMTANDNTLQRVSRYVQDGWPEQLPKSEGSIKPYFNRRFCLSFQNGVLLLQAEYTRVVLPKALQSQVLNLLHEGHWGKGRMKQMARRYVWFPLIDKAIERIHDDCSSCQQGASQPKREFSAWPEPSRPWERVHLDFAGPFFKLTKIMKEEQHIDKALYKYLTTYRTTPNLATDKSPAELLHGRQPRTILSALFPKVMETMKTQNRSKFGVGEKVLARNYSGSHKWVRGVIQKLLGNKMYFIQTENGYIKRHQNQIRRNLSSSHSNQLRADNIDIDLDFGIRTPPVEETTITTGSDPEHSQTEKDDKMGTDETIITTGSDLKQNQREKDDKAESDDRYGSTHTDQLPVQLRRSVRRRRQPVRFNLE
ncbi:uncharacterized protein K02A2.6-like [Teleopsis dalmanni]|uniref:uncharacterized protein K02A2.6-like n=1 Tax=Teleopsis dalmanni TaxID=139649 RepID=UPI0018CC9C0E|nr:uncharacterized protein K02A2.6-like [Teleopsis dalmanni]